MLAFPDQFPMKCVLPIQVDQHHWGIAASGAKSEIDEAVAQRGSTLSSEAVVRSR